MPLLELTDQNFETEVLKLPLPALVDFWADWCSPCLMVAPVIEEIAKEYEGRIKVGKLNVDKSPKTAAKYGVMSIPTVILFKNGQEVDREVGFGGRGGYEKLIQRVIQ